MMFLFRRMIPLAVLALAACSAPSAAPRAPEPDPAAALAGAEATITAEDTRARIAFLASDELKGRDTPSPGLEKAARYIADAFESFGLRPAGDEGGYIQRWPYAVRELERSDVALSITGADDELVYGRDFFVMPAATDGADAEAVFLGSVDALGDAWPAEAAGRVAVVAIGPRLTGMQLLSAVQKAADAGAAGVLLVLHPMHTSQVVAAVAPQLEEMPVESPVPLAGVLRSRVEPVLQEQGVELDGDSIPAGPKVLASTRVRIQAPVNRQEHQVPNVVAMLPGTDPQLKDEYVVLTAHFDHVGVGQPDESGDSIYNGADDDASGTSAIMEVAEALASLPTAPRRSVVFLLVSGEEKGLLGALHYADHPTVPMENVVANINLDMVGRNAPDTLVAIGQEYTSLGPLAHHIVRENPELGLTVIQDPQPEEQAFFRSDHVAFLLKDVPSIFFTTWLHDDYHKPSDEVDRIDADKAARVARLVMRMTHAIANDPQPPTWLGDGLEQVRERLKDSPFGQRRSTAATSR